MEKLYTVKLAMVVASESCDYAAVVAKEQCRFKSTVLSVHEVFHKEDLPEPWSVDAYPIRRQWKDETIGDFFDTRQRERQKKLDKVHVLNSKIAALQKEVDELSKDI